jgi:hypothetical protein
LRASGNHPTNQADAAASEAGRLEQFSAVAVALGIEIKGLEPGQVDAQLRARLSANRQPFLWIVDDLASGLEADAVKAWLAPAPLGKTLITTRSREYRTIGAAMPLDVLTPKEAIDLLCSRRAPVGSVEQAAAEGIAQDLGYHALAADVTAAALAAQAGMVSFGEFRANLSNPGQDELELAAEFSDLLPSGHEKSVAATMLRSVRHLEEEGQDFLRLASLLAVAPIPPTVVVAMFLDVDDLAEPDAKRRAIRGQHQAEAASLAERGEEDTRQVHALVSRTMRFHDTKPERREALRVAIVVALTNVLSEGVRRHPGVLALELQHARALLGSEDPWDRGSQILASWVAKRDYERGLYATARALQERLLKAQSLVLGEDHLDTLMSMNNLAATLSAQGDLAGARGLHERVLESQRRVLGEGHPDTLTSMSNLAETQRAQGDLAGARGLQESVLEASAECWARTIPTHSPA